MVLEYPAAKVIANTPLFVGDTAPACMPIPLYDLIIRQIHGVCNSKGDIKHGSYHKEDRDVMNQPKLKVRDVIKAVKNANIFQQQQKDRTLDKVPGYFHSKRFHKSE